MTTRAESLLRLRPRLRHGHIVTQSTFAVAALRVRRLNSASG